MNFDFNIFAGQPGLPTLWFVAIGVFLIMYMILDGFDLGVGMLMGSKFAKNENCLLYTSPSPKATPT